MDTLSVSRFDVYDLWRRADRMAHALANGSPVDGAVKNAWMAEIEVLLAEPLYPEDRGAIETALSRARSAPDIQISAVATHAFEIAAGLRRIFPPRSHDPYHFSGTKTKKAAYQAFLRGALKADDARRGVARPWFDLRDVSRLSGLTIEESRRSLARAVDDECAWYRFVEEEPDAEVFGLDTPDAESVLEELCNTMLQATLEIPWLDELHHDYADVVRGLAARHGLSLQTADPTNDGLFVEVTALGGEDDWFKSATDAFAKEVKAALGRRRVMLPEGAAVNTVSIGGSVYGSPIQVGGSGDQNAVNMGHFGAVGEAFRQARDAIQEANLPPEIGAEVDADLAAIDLQLRKANPDPHVMSAAGRSAIGVLTAVGGAGQGVEYLTRLVQWLAPFLS